LEKSAPCASLPDLVQQLSRFSRNAFIVRVHRDLLEERVDMGRSLAIGVIGAAKSSAATGLAAILFATPMARAKGLFPHPAIMLGIGAPV